MEPRREALVFDPIGGSTAVVPGRCAVWDDGPGLLTGAAMADLQRSPVPFAATELERINRWPIGVLAEAAIRAGADAASAIAHAQTLLGAHGTSRRIDAEHAEALLRSMQDWAAQT